MINDISLVFIVMKNGVPSKIFLNRCFFVYFCH